MAENENVAVKEEVSTPEQQTAPQKPSKPGFGARVKEWFRKQCVNLKRKPQKIAFFFFIVSSVMYLIGLSVTSPGPVKDFASQPYLGLSVFITTLFSILVLVLFLNTFPKHGIRYKKVGGKKHTMNYIMLALTFIFVIVMFLMDLLYYKQLAACINTSESKFFLTIEQARRFEKYLSVPLDQLVLNNDSYRTWLVPALDLTIAHMVFLGISALLLATLPLYKKLIMKINTSKVIESNEMNEVIDTED